MDRMYCAFDKDRICSSDCAARKEVEECSVSEYVWDTCLKEYVRRFNTVRSGKFCKRLGYCIGEVKLIKKEGKDVE